MENKKKERMSTNKKTELVLQLLRGESLDELCRIHHVSASQLSEWRDIFVSKGKEGFRKSSDDHRLRALVAARLLALGGLAPRRHRVPVAAGAAAAVKAAFERGDGQLLHRSAGVERVDDQAVGHLACHPDHARTEAADEDRGPAVRVRSGIERLRALLDGYEAMEKTMKREVSQ